MEEKAEWPKIQRGQMTSRRLSSRPSSNNGDTYSQRLQQEAQDLYVFGPDGVPALKGGSGQGLSPLNMQLTKTDTHCQRKIGVLQ